MKSIPHEFCKANVPNDGCGMHSLPKYEQLNIWLDTLDHCLFYTLILIKIALPRSYNKDYSNDEI